MTSSSVPRVSVVLVTYNMAREAPRTFKSLESTYTGFPDDQLEVLVVDNASSEPLPPSVVAGFPDNWRLVTRPRSNGSPVEAVNEGAALASGDVVGICIDGARILSPGILPLVGQAFSSLDDPLVLTLGWHLGPDVQMRSVADGYTREIEDDLLRQSRWHKNGYALFDISSLAGSSAGGWFGPLAESNCMFVSRTTFDELGGFDRRFDSPGGGLANHEFFARACAHRPDETVVLLGEGTFHQHHGGAATSNPGYFARHLAQYEAITGGPYAVPNIDPIYLGRLPDEARRFLKPSAAATV